MKKLALGVFVLVVLSSCAYPTVQMEMETDIQLYGPDTYTLMVVQVPVNNTFPISLSPADLKEEGLTKAQVKCREINKQFMPVASTLSGKNLSLTYDLTFRCLSEGDPELKRPDKGTEIVLPEETNVKGGNTIIMPPYIPPYYY